MKVSLHRIRSSYVAVMQLSIMDRSAGSSKVLDKPMNPQFKDHKTSCPLQHSVIMILFDKISTVLLSF